MLTSVRQLTAAGLVPGITLRLQVGRGSNVETLSTVVEHISERRIEVLAPMHQRRVRVIPAGALVSCEFTHERRVIRFTSEALGRSHDGVCEYLSVPAGLESSERRWSFRLTTAIQPALAVRLVAVSEGDLESEPLSRPVILDLSEGGLCISCQGHVARGDALRISAELGEFGAVDVVARVIEVDEPERGYRNRRAHCRFQEIARQDRERIARYLIRKQIELRKGGKL